MNIEVAEGIQVVHDGHRYAGGDIADVPQHLGEKWIRAGWASEVAPQGTEERPTPAAEKPSHPVRAARR